MRRAGSPGPPPLATEWPQLCLRREAWQDLFANLVFAERSLIAFEAKAPQPTSEVHDGAHNQWWRTSSSGEASVSRMALGFSGLRKAR
jgi:hypothetical protein